MYFWIPYKCLLLKELDNIDSWRQINKHIHKCCFCKTVTFLKRWQEQPKLITTRSYHHLITTSSRMTVRRVSKRNLLRKWRHYIHAGCDYQAYFLKEDTSYCQLKFPSIHEQNCGELSIKIKQINKGTYLKPSTEHTHPKSRTHTSQISGESCAD